ncbi:MAG: ATP-binding protein [Pseudomonadota bacterium]
MRLLLAELLLTLLEVALVGTPVVLLVRDGIRASHAAPALLPWLGGLWLLSFVGSASTLRPIWTALGMKHRQEALSAAVAEGVQAAIRRAPIETGRLRTAAWTIAAVLLAVRLAHHGDLPWTSGAGVVTMALLYAGAAGTLRSIVWQRLLEEARRTVLPNIDPLRVFASTYRRRLARTALSLLGMTHAVIAALTAVFTELSSGHAALLAALTAPALLPVLAFCGRSLYRRTLPIERYLDLAVRFPPTRGPARDEPRAVEAFNAAQSIPYRLAAYQAIWSTLAALAVISFGRRLVGFDTATAARLLAAVSLIVLAMGLYETLLLRDVLRPLLGQLGSRHRLPVNDIRAAAGLRSKLVGFFASVTVLTSGLVVLFALAPARQLPTFIASVTLVLALSLGLVLLIVRDIVTPIRALEERTEEMARGELARPVPPSGEADEIGRLTFAFEEMRRGLRDKLRSTESLNIDLEREVRRRTEVLEQRNVELREALEKLRRAQDDLVRSEKLASMGRLVAGIAHEINNPVNAVINTIGPLDELIRSLGKAPDAAALEALGRDAGEMLAVIQRGATRSKAIVQALHNYSRGDDEQPREVNLARSVDDTVDLLRHRLKDVRIERHIDSALRVVGFPGQIDQVLMNLVTNAAQAIGGRAGGGTIGISTQAQDDLAILTVTDDGPGIPPELLPRIFDPFFTTKDVGEGSGLGFRSCTGSSNVTAAASASTAGAAALNAARERSHARAADVPACRVAGDLFPAGPGAAALNATLVSRAVHGAGAAVGARADDGAGAGDALHALRAGLRADAADGALRSAATDAAPARSLALARDLAQHR